MALVSNSMHGARRIPRFYGVMAVLLVTLAGLGTLLGWGRTGFLVDVVPLPTSEHNLIQASEFPESDLWSGYGVAVTPGELEFPEQTITSMTVTKEEPAGWVRLQQVIDLETGVPYTASASMRTDANAVRYGIQDLAHRQDGRMCSGLVDS